jgi:hypothetical protein
MSNREKGRLGRVSNDFRVDKGRRDQGKHDKNGGGGERREHRENERQREGRKGAKGGQGER